MLFYEKELKALNKSKIKYLVVGGLAVNLYGLHRLTMDLDLMIDLAKDNFSKFIRVIGELGYVTNVPEKEWSKHLAIAFIYRKDKDRRIDVFLKNPINFKKAFANRKVFSVDRLRVACVGFDDLLVLKSKANRLRDWVDVGSLKRMREIEQNET
jgi:predicted nucleotidyltransferase